MNLPNKELRNEINNLWKKLFKANEQSEEKVGFAISFGSILNAYREADISFENAVKFCQEAQEYNLKQNGVVIIKRLENTYILLLNEPIEKGNVTFLDSTGDNYNVYWMYECTGLHSGKSIKICVKNPRWEADGDESGVYYSIDYDNLFWADNLKDQIDDDIHDTYGDLIRDMLKIDLSQT
jgi:hypothetical protein